MEKISLKKQKTKSFKETQRRAEEAISLESSDDYIMLGWYDRKQHKGGPAEVCGDEPLKVALDYAKSFDAEYRVSGKPYELFFRSIPEDTAELDRSTLIEIHKEIEFDRFENLQGG